MLLLEYLEERPLFLNAKGMGLRLTSYYRWVESGWVAGERSRGMGMGVWVRWGWPCG